MCTIKTFLRNRAVLTLLALMLVWGSFTVMTPKVHACSPNDAEIIYYTDASKTVECGYKYIFCYCGGTYSEGCVTPYRNTYSYPCF